MNKLLDILNKDSSSKSKRELLKDLQRAGRKTPRVTPKDLEIIRNLLDNEVKEMYVKAFVQRRHGVSLMQAIDIITLAKKEMEDAE